MGKIITEEKIFSETVWKVSLDNDFIHLNFIGDMTSPPIVRLLALMNPGSKEYYYWVHLFDGIDFMQ